MKTSKIMKIINKTIASGTTILSQEDVKKLFGSCNEDVLEQLKIIDCNVEVTDGVYVVTLTRQFEKEEIEVEQIIEWMEDF